MAELPAEIVSLLRERDEARAAKQYARADAARDRIQALGFDVRDASGGSTAVAKAPYERVDPAAVPSALGDPPECDIEIQVLHEGFREDVDRFLGELHNHCGHHDYRVLLVDATGDDGEWIEERASDRVRTLHLGKSDGWAQSRNAALRTATGNVVVVADLSVEATGDLLGPVLAAFDDASVGIAGPWGLRSENMRDFESAPAGEVDAVEGYFLAVRRKLLADALFDEKFKWYRHADIDLCFQIRAMGYKAVAVDAPAIKHVHRAWDALEHDEDERAKRSKRNFNRFLDHFRDRRDLLIANRDEV